MYKLEGFDRNAGFITILCSKGADMKTKSKKQRLRDAYDDVNMRTDRVIFVLEVMKATGQGGEFENLLNMYDKAVRSAFSLNKENVSYYKHHT